MATELEVAQQDLTDTRTAIRAILVSGQSGAVQGRQLTKADLGTLYERESTLIARVGRLTRGGIRTSQLVPL